MRDGLQYKLVYKRGTAPWMDGVDLHAELETTGVPPGGVRWKLETRYRPSKPAYRNVMLQSILAMCKKHELTPIDIRTPPSQGGDNFIDVIFAKGEDVLKAYENELTFDFYGTRPKVEDRGIPDYRHMALCIELLPAMCDIEKMLAVLRGHPRIQKAGSVVDVWSVHHPVSMTFAGRLLVLLKLHTQDGLVPLEARAAVPGWMLYDGIAYIVRFASRPAWCVVCRYDERGSFHCASTCPRAPCITCESPKHMSVDCARRQRHVAKKESKASGSGPSREQRPFASERASMERQFAELGIQGGSKEAAELARDFGVLALSESDIIA